MKTSVPASFQKVRLGAGIVAVTVLVLVGLWWQLAERTIFPNYRYRLFQAPVTSIRSIRVRPGNTFPLVDHEVVITNALTIQAIMKAIRSAEKDSSNHPTTRWSCTLMISGSSGESYVDVIESFGQGTILDCQTDVGFVFDTLQSSVLGTVLEQATSQNNQ